MSLLDDVVDSLVGGTQVPQVDPSSTVPHQEAASQPRSPAPALRVPTHGVQLRIVVEAVDASGRVARASHSADVPKGTITMMEMLSAGEDDVLQQIATSAVAAAAKGVTPQPGGRGGGQILEMAASAPGPVGGRTKKTEDDPLASMLGLDLIEHQESLDRGVPTPQAPRPPPPRQRQPMGGPHTAGPRPGSGHPR